MDTAFPFADWFRNSSPYIDAHRGRTFVILVESEALADHEQSSLIQDLALLHTLGVRLVLVFGVRESTAQALSVAGIVPRRHQQQVVIDDAAMAVIEREIARLRLLIEARLSPGLPNSPLHGMEINALSGNLVMARPVGIRDGVDFQHAGEVRRVRASAIRGLLEQQAVVILPPLGYSSTGEVFDLDAAEVARETAIALEADKLILLGHAAGLHDARGRLCHQLTPGEANALEESVNPPAELRRHLHIACEAARQGVGRTHLVSWQDRDALLGELFTRDGVGTMITRERYEQVRPARLEDIGGLLALLQPLEARGVLVTRSRERLEQDIEDYIVIERDGMVIGCAALHPFSEAGSGELACVVVHDNYRGGDRGNLLLSAIEREARRQGLSELFALTTHTAHWFFEHGFVEGEVSTLPERRRVSWNPQRNSRVLVRPL
ncbi:amino-acid N-acetyltransferase [Kushneria phosphatilytica]|uniref:Amino-acid acetyltransferase n=1 Tax=Kushneria phosphatilytica TaxID=657387 RepID=A0A1S1NZH1_9GAMM|nr:amino-acid N-acetyltransferase [Kushneria phosphatilytica]OHV13884.1 amino-acid N-acetyltransferase [Kushneria phosphatilytica]QEL10443.1 amino-acid N-acetyltransferase [Kushneria phosphatilytica]